MLWSAPRSRSTAFFRMMAERGDFTVVHEPFSYLAELGYADVAGERITSAAGLESQYEIFTEVSRLTGRAPVVIDSDDLITRPAAIVQAWCTRVGIDFRPGALTWPPADHPEWQPSRRWHAEAAASTGFARMSAWPTVDVERDPVLNAYLRHHLPFYERLHAQRLT
ncbi:MAG TPA: hypothetical protein VHZ96_19725 [Frankiaceae bacterium]|jgi:hypothetical protein|nr:hypothetical protein [Frankiaceae bacterium]